MDCTETRELITSPAFLLVLSSQALAGFFSAVFSVIVTRKCGRLYFHINCRILMISLLLFYIAHSFFISTLQTIQVVRYLEDPDSCDVGIAPGLCFWLRFPATICTVSCAFLQFVMVVERAIALWKRESYDKFGPKLGLAFTAVSIIVSAASTVWALRIEDFSERTTYCSGSTSTSADRVTVLLFSLCGIDLTTLVGILVLFILNSMALKRNFFNLQSSYQLRENISVIRFILPLTIFQTICYLVFSGSSGVLSVFSDSVSILTYRILLAAFYVIPIYTMISPILISFIIRWSQESKESKLRAFKKHKDQKDLYFRTYADMWKNGLSDKC